MSSLLSNRPARQVDDAALEFEEVDRQPAMQDAGLPLGGMFQDTHARHQRLMVVATDHDQVDALCEWIELSSDWEATPAYGPAEAIARVGDLPPDVILLDLEMQGSDGFTTADRLEDASGTKHSTILALTGNANLYDAALVDPRFATAMLKPADPTALLSVLSGLQHKN